MGEHFYGLCYQGRKKCVSRYSMLLDIFDWYRHYILVYVKEHHIYITSLGEEFII